MTNRTRRHALRSFLFVVSAVAVCVTLFFAPLKFGIMHMDAAQPLLPMPHGFWEWLYFSYPVSFLVWMIGVTSCCALALFLIQPPARLPSVARLTALGWGLFVLAILVADRSIPHEWIDHQARIPFLLYGPWMMAAALVATREPARSFAVQALITTLCLVALEALQQHFGGLERMREYAAREAGFDSLSAYTNHLLRGCPDPQTLLLVKKLTSQRVYGTFVYPNALGGFLLVALPVALACAVQASHRLVRSLAWLATLLASAALMFSRSKASIVLAAVAMVMLIFSAWRARVVSTLKLTLVTGGIIAGAAAMLLWGYGEGLSDRLQATGGARLDYWRAALRIIARKPVTGWGSGGFARAYPVFRTEGAEDTRLAHNVVLNCWTDYGLAGVFGLSLALGAPLVVGWRRLVSSVRSAVSFDWIHAAAVVAYTVCLLHCLVDFDFHIPGIMLPALWLAACAASGAETKVLP